MKRTIPFALFTVILFASFFAGSASANGVVKREFTITNNRVVLITDHFTIFVPLNDTTKEYGVKVAQNLEDGYAKFIGEWKYKLSEKTRGVRVLVFVKTRVGGSDSYRGMAHWNNDRADTIDIKTGLAEEQLRATCVHEFFHVCQHGFFKDEETWIIEGTAVWSQSFFVDNRDYRDRLPSFFRRRNLPLNHKEQYYAYGTSVFWTYLTKRLDKDIVKKVFEECGKTAAKDDMKALYRALGDGERPGPKFRALYYDFCIANIAMFVANGRHENIAEEKYRYSKDWKRYEGPLADYHVLNSTGNRYYRSYDAAANAIESRETSSVGIAARYAVFGVPKRLRTALPLSVAYGDSPDREWRYAIALRDALGKIKIRKVSTPAAGHRSLHVERVGGEGGGHTVDVVLVAVRVSSQTAAKKYDYLACLGNPPSVKELRVKQGDEVKYHSIWNRSGNTRVKSNPADQPVDLEGGTVQLRVEFRFDTPVEPYDVRVKFADVENRARPIRSGDFTKYYAEVSLDAERIREEYVERGRRVPIRVRAQAGVREWLDTRPGTAITLDAEAKCWDNYDRATADEDNWDATHSVAVSGVRRPPHLAGCTVAQGGETVYNGEWQSVGNSRQFTTKDRRAYEADKEAQISLVFSDDVSKNGVEVEIAGGKIALTSQDIKRRYWSGTIAPSEKIRQEIAEKGRAVIRVKIGEAGGEFPHLDTDPGTIAEFDTAAKVWTKYEKGEEPDAGFDTWHKFGVAKGTSFVIVLDASGSMGYSSKTGEEGGPPPSRMDVAKESLQRAIEKMGPDDEVALIVFYTCGDIRVEVDFTTDKQAVRDKVQGVSPGGGTPLAAAIKLANEHMKKYARRAKTSILVFSDGQESCDGDPIRESEKVTNPPTEPPKSEPEEEPEHPCKNEYRVAYRVLPPAATRHIPDIYVEEMRYRKKRVGKKCTLMVTILKRHIDYASSVNLETGERRTAWGLGGIKDRKTEIVEDIHTEKEKAQKLENKAKEYTMTRAEALAEVAKLVKAAVEGGAEPPSP